MHVLVICKFHEDPAKKRRSYAGHKHFPIVSIWDLLSAIAGCRGIAVRK